MTSNMTRWAQVYNLNSSAISHAPHAREWKVLSAHHAILLNQALLRSIFLVQLAFHLVLRAFLMKISFANRAQPSAKLALTQRLAPLARLMQQVSLGSWMVLGATTDAQTHSMETLPSCAESVTPTARLAQTQLLTVHLASRIATSLSSPSHSVWVDATVVSHPLTSSVSNAGLPVLPV